MQERNEKLEAMEKMIGKVERVEEAKREGELTRTDE